MSGSYCKHNPSSLRRLAPCLAPRLAPRLAPCLAPCLAPRLAPRLAIACSAASLLFCCVCVSSISLLSRLASGYSLMSSNPPPTTSAHNLSLTVWLTSLSQVGAYSGDLGTAKWPILGAMYAMALLALMCHAAIFFEWNSGSVLISRSEMNSFPLPAEVDQLIRAGRPIATLPHNIESGNDTFCIRCLVWRRAGADAASARGVERARQRRRWKKSHAHHCSVCQRCVKDFDHHCGVLGRCISGRRATPSMPHPR